MRTENIHNAIKVYNGTASLKIGSEVIAKGISCLLLQTGFFILTPVICTRLSNTYTGKGLFLPVSKITSDMSELKEQKLEKRIKCFDLYTGKQNNSF